MCIVYLYTVFNQIYSVFLSVNGELNLEYRVIGLEVIVNVSEQHITVKGYLTGVNTGNRSSTLSGFSQ